MACIVPIMGGIPGGSMPGCCIIGTGMGGIIMGIVPIGGIMPMAAIAAA